jgi:hypothetical protein
MYCVVLTVDCGYPPNKYFLDAERKLNGVTQSDEQMNAKFEVNRGAERGRTQREVTNPSQVCFLA